MVQTMTDRERLIELISTKQTNGVTEYANFPTVSNVELADYLLANGVIVPPCKVGQTVYFVYETDNETMFIDKGTIQSLSIDENGIWFRAIYENLSSYWHTALSIGDTVFLTKEEAERALKERENNVNGLG
jgi:hypothetical protein